MEVLPYSAWVTGRLSNKNNFATSAALAEVCASFFDLDRVSRFITN